MPNIIFPLFTANKMMIINYTILFHNNTREQHKGTVLLCHRKIIPEQHIINAYDTGEPSPCVLRILFSYKGKPKYKMILPL
jgi:hypothetical protein